MFADRPMKDWVTDLCDAAPDRRRDRRLRLLGWHPGDGAQPVDVDRPAVPQAGQGRIPRPGLPLEDRACPSSTSRAVRRTPTGSPRSSSRSPPAAPATSRWTNCTGLQTFFKTFTQTGCTRVQFFEYKQSTTVVRRGHPYRLPVLRVRLPRPDDAFAVQPDPVEPPVIEDPGGHAVPGLHRAGVPASSIWRPARCSRPRRSAE